MSAVWVVRAGDSIEHQWYALNSDCVIINFKAAGGSLESLDTREKVKEAYKKRHHGQDLDDKKIGNAAGQCYAFAHKIEKGDYVIMPRKEEDVRGNLVNMNRTAVGKITGNYKYNENADDGCKHQRPVQWENKEVSNDEMPWRIHSQLTVSRVRRENASRDLESALKKAH